MEVTFVRNDAKRRNTSVMYTSGGRRGSLRISKSLLTTPPDTLVLSHDSFAGPKVTAARLTPEERKALRASRPKLTLAEKIVKREAALAKLKATAASASL